MKPSILIFGTTEKNVQIISKMLSCSNRIFQHKYVKVRDLKFLDILKFPHFLLSVCIQKINKTLIQKRIKGVNSYPFELTTCLCLRSQNKKVKAGKFQTKRKVNTSSNYNSTRTHIFDVQKDLFNFVPACTEDKKFPSSIQAGIKLNMSFPLAQVLLLPILNKKRKCFARTYVQKCKLRQK